MNNVININGNNENIVFNVHQASALVPTLLSITKKTKDKIAVLKSQLEVHKFNQDRADLIEKDIHDIIQKWGDKVIRLGMTPIGIWKVLIPGEDIQEEDILRLEKEEIENGKFYEWEYPASKLTLSQKN